jgi:hypothetical protein
METLLTLFKQDLGVTHNKRDVYFTALLNSVIGELGRKGIAIDPESAESDDLFLIVDYAAWQYRSRTLTDDISIPQNLQLRIRNRKIRNRSEVSDDE